MSKKGGKFDFLAEEREQRSTDGGMAQEGETESAQDRKRTNAQSSIVRRPSGQRIRADLLRAYKILSAETGKPQYLLIEEALEEYLARKRTS